MCGICGVLERKGVPSPAVLSAMTRTLAHRGPDAGGVHIDGAVGLGHRRLSIIDLSEAARQPLTNEDAIALARLQRRDLQLPRAAREPSSPEHRFLSDSDGEVILHLYEERGDEAIRALDGMFALALWDTPEARLLLARDRAGKKPLLLPRRPEPLRVWLGGEGASRPS